MDSPVNGEVLIVIPFFLCESDMSVSSKQHIISNPSRELWDRCQFDDLPRV